MLDEFLALVLNTTGWIVLLVILVWTLPWKGVALWKAARAGNKTWFIVFLVVNTVAVLEILYIFVFSKKEGGKSNDIVKRQEANISNKQEATG